MNTSEASNRFLVVAEDIGMRLCQHAFWHKSLCNWVGRSLDELFENISIRALSPEIYEGTSGIAIFLSNLYVCTNKKHEEYRRTAQGAINHALSRIGDIPQFSRFGLYNGHAGIAYAAAEIGYRLEDQKLIESALQIVHRLAKDRDSDHLSDIISGAAGAIPSLLRVYAITNERKALELATDLGDELISTATREPYGWSWNYKSSGLQSALHNLTGFSHGAAGIGCSLLELYSTTEKKQYLDATEFAFQYENHWFSDQNENWPDFRSEDNNESSTQDLKKGGENARREKDQKFAVAWCHGAPGIGLSRLRAYQILKDEKYLKDIHAALNTTMRAANGVNENNASVQYNNFSLCHGLSGIGEILLNAGQILDDNGETYRLLAGEIGKYGIEKYASQSLPWPCDVRIGETLGLMIGISGIGNFYLRLACPDEVCSPLIIIPHQSTDGS